KRLKPISLAPDIDLQKRFPSYDKLNHEIMQYALSLYNPSKYVKEEFKDLYRKKARSRMLAFEQETREHFLIGMMKVNFLKRLESSIESFEISLDRTIKKIDKLQEKIDSFNANLANELSVYSDEFIEDVEKEEDDDVNEAAEMWQVGAKLKFELAHLDLESWKEDLKKDNNQLLTIYNSAVTVTPDRDEKLLRLKELIADKISNPLNNLPSLESEDTIPNHKILIFTAFTDTASYLFDHLKPWITDEFNLNIALVTGGNSSNKSTFDLKGYLQQTEFNNILSNFSPRSKKRHYMKAMPQSGEIDILIATDCISEGQNLQDCDYLINYDIHWNPVRIIQRFGRIDRLGSTNDQIQLVNFWPTDDLNKYINLKDRVEMRMALVDLTASADDNLLKKEEIKDILIDDWKYREKQLLRLKEEVLDLEDMDDNISLTDFTLDDFRIELANFLENNKKLLEEMQFGLYAVVPAPEGSFGDEIQKDIFDAAAHKIIKPGVIFCLKQKIISQDNEVVNPLNPFFLIYIYDDGNVRFNFTNAKQILEIYRLLCQSKKEPYKQLCELFDTDTNNGSDMSEYNNLIQKAIKLIIRVFNKRNISRLSSRRDAILVPKDSQIEKLDDFELITWLIIK
nr:SWF/SNF helicase family protein [Candidatus Cloacimonadota bacterium]